MESVVTATQQPHDRGMVRERCSPENPTPAPALLWIGRGVGGLLAAIIVQWSVTRAPFPTAAVACVGLAFVVGMFFGREAAVPAATAGALGCALWHLADANGVLETTAQTRVFFVVLGAAIGAAMIGDRRHSAVRRSPINATGSYRVPFEQG